MLCFFFCVFFYLVHHFKINAQSSWGVETAHFPLACAADTHLLHKTENTLWWMPVKNSSQMAYCKKEGIWMSQFQGQWLTFSETLEPLELSETQGPMAPHTFSSLDVYTNRKRKVIQLLRGSYKSILCSEMDNCGTSNSCLHCKHKHTKKQLHELSTQCVSMTTITSLPWPPGCLRRPCGSLHCNLCWRLSGRFAWTGRCWRSLPSLCGPWKYRTTNP